MKGKIMGTKVEWTEDSEALGIAMEVMEKFEETFSGIDLGQIRFVRVLGKKNGKAVKVSPVAFPYNIDIRYLYYMMIDDGKWHEMNDAQRNLTIFSGLFEIAPGGMDPESSNYGKKRKRDVEDFEEVLAAAGGRYDWKKTGATGIHDILNIKTEDNIETD
jgi:hypothetical protein